MTVSKTKSSFYRRLYVAWLIDSGTAVSVPAIVEATGMPRRTAQDTLAALADLDIDCRFVQEAGPERLRSDRRRSSSRADTALAISSVVVRRTCR